MPKDSTNLRTAQKNKSDEFYTLIEDIAEEIEYIKDQFYNKCIYSPCDGDNSAFVEFFKNNFDRLSLKAFYYSYHDINDSENDYHVEVTGGGKQERRIYSNANFLTSIESQALLERCDIVVTNPPFSLFKEFIPWIFKSHKQLLVVGNMNAACNKNIFPFIKNKLLWKSPRDKAWNFKYSDSYQNYSSNLSSNLINIGGIVWYTNLEFNNIPHIQLIESYDELQHPKLDNYNAINVNKTSAIPYNYDSEIAVPVSFFLRYSKEQFEIVDVLPVPRLRGKNLYNRLIIKKKNFSDKKRC